LQRDTFNLNLVKDADKEINLQRQVMKTSLMYRKYKIITYVLRFFTNFYYKCKQTAISLKVCYPRCVVN